MLAVPYQQDECVSSFPSLLIIETDPTVRMLLQDLFEQDYTLTFAESGTQALAALREQSVDLALLDVTIPETGGFDVLRGIRSEPCAAELRVILILALEDSSGSVLGLQLGANDYITKPLDSDVVRARVSTQIALKRADGERKPTLAHVKFTQDMQENFTRVVSHDLKGPLTNIRMAQFMLRDILHDNEEARSILDNMDVTLNSMSEMIRVFLDAMDSQKLEPTLEALNIHDMIVQVIEQYRMAAERKQIHVTMYDCDHRVLADARLLRQVISNLVSNAIKFSPPGTRTCVSAQQNADIVRICIADGGPGIRLDERGKLFNMFSKLSTRPTGGETSTGLGLWIVKELTQLQNGRVGVDQPAEGGSVFWIELMSASRA